VHHLHRSKQNVGARGRQVHLLRDCAYHLEQRNGRDLDLLEVVGAGRNVHKLEMSVDASITVN
jgi:hypothetical protein